MFGFVTAYAGSPFNITDGSMSFLKQQAEANLVIDWSKTMYGDNKQLKDAFSETEYQNYTSKSEKVFVSSFNKKSKKLKISDSNDAKYEIKIIINKIDYFYSIMSLVPGHKHTIYADVIITSKETNSIICKLEASRLKGDRDFIKEDSFYKCFESFAEELASLK